MHLNKCLKCTQIDLMKHIILFLSFILCVHSNLAAQPVPSKPIHSYTLDNGLELYVIEDHVVPLAYIEIAVRTGAISQRADTAGLFHLYEHMMFKGNALYPTAAEVNRALSDMGVASWNGSTAIAHVNYYFTIPSAMLESGLAFWNAAIRSPRMSERELESEKRVVLSEIEGSKADPSRVISKWLTAQTFPDAPYKTDPSGSFDVVKSATVSDLVAIQKEFYVPNNAALFVGGDVDPDAVFELVKRIYGTWQRGSDVCESFHHTRRPFETTRFAVMPTDKVSDGLAQITVQYRGPDAQFDRADTVSFDYLLCLMDESDGYFTRRLYECGKFNIVDFNDSWVSYPTRRNTGVIEFGTIVDASKGRIAEQAQDFVSTIQDDILPVMTSEKKLYSKAKRRAVIEREKDNRAKATQTAESALRNLRSLWVHADYEYYTSYWDSLEAVRQPDVKAVADKYLMGANGLVCVFVNPAVYEAERERFEKLGFYRIRDDESYWWQSERWQAATQKRAPQGDAEDAPREDAIYRPSAQVQSAQVHPPTRRVRQYTLKNGIPLYIHETQSDVQAVAIYCKGGVARLTSDTSGLEAALFSFMEKSSAHYSYQQRTKFFADTGSYVGHISKLSGTCLYMTSLNKHFDDTFKVFVDGFLCPEIDDEQYASKMMDLHQSVQSTLTTADRLLAFTISDSLYKAHPYDAKTYATAASLDNITQENLMAHHSRILREGGIFVVASGSISAKKLIKRLNSTLGRLLMDEAAFSAPQVPPITVQSQADTVLRLPSLVASANVSRVFSAPPNTSDEFMPCVLAAEIYTDVLFNVVREHYGMCYSPQSYVVGSHAGYGVEHLYKVSDLKGFAAATAEARSYMAQGKLVDSSTEDGSLRFVSLDERLGSYKSSYVNETYDDCQTSRDMIETLGYNVLQFGDVNHDLEWLKQLEHISSDEVLAAFNKWWLQGGSAWYAVTGLEDTLSFTED